MYARPLPGAGRLGRFAMFIDGSNFYHTIRDLGLHVDYRRLREFFADQGELRRAYYYTALLEGDQTPEWLVRLTDWLSYNGYNVVTTRARTLQRRIQDDSGTTRVESQTKGNADIELTIDMITMAPLCDTLILFSGDGDFHCLIKAVQQRGTRVIVVSSERTSDSTVADELRRQADQFIELMDIAEHIKMQGRER